MIIGLTGGMGCGKSTAAIIFEELGFARLDSDELIRTRILLDPEVEKAAATHFGSGVLAASGRINRTALAHAIFSDDSRLRTWEEIVHPRLYGLWRTFIDAAPARHWLIEVPLLHEKQLEKWFDFIVCITTTSPRQFARLQERGLSQALAEARISKQLPLAKKTELADFVLSNDGSPRFLRDQIAHLVARLGLNR
ncbi:dephospho-CoA kinase [Nibricoccus aquaticus]|uniref:Dephospho-CoA kinase n=1 Tax=Nibricoccus aquaticus TaxID=2576891 RepID=A0A290QAM3_9BACT|nr:dephospho-CoA kinase [Nibricoccus aquaticus]ATC65483.1 dephospho-CoA kinase [Nibricoccus aquaticus]